MGFPTVGRSSARILFTAVVAGVGIGVAAYAWVWNANKQLLRPDDKALVAVGETLYQRTCSSCHGIRLEGQQNWRERGANGMLPAPPHDATGHTWHHPDAVLFSLTKFGVQPFAEPGYRSSMPAFEGKLSDEDVLAILSYIKSTWPPDIRRRHDAINEASGQQHDG